MALHQVKRTVGMTALSALIALFGTLFATGSGGASAAQRSTPQAQSAADQSDQDMMAMHRKMMAMRQQIMTDIEAGDAQLQQFVDQMNAARGDAKIEAMAALLIELTSQHRAAQQRMGQMMMPGMMDMMGMVEGMNTNMQNMMRGRGRQTPPQQ